MIGNNRGVTRGVIVLLLILLMAGGASADGTKAEHLKHQREAKKQTQQTPVVSRGERLMYWLERGGFRTLFNLNYGGIYPKFKSLSTGSGFAPGIRYYRQDIRNSPLDLEITASYSFRAYQLYSVEFGKIEPIRKQFFLTANNWGGQSEVEENAPYEPQYYAYLDVTWRDFTQEDFFGIGPDSRNADRTDYRLKGPTYDIVAGYQFNRHFGLGLRTGLVKPEILTGTDARFPDTQSLFTDATAPGLTGQPTFLRVSPTAILDFRDVPGNPHSGAIAGVAYTRMEDRDSGQYSFNRVAVDLRGYVPVGSIARVLALRTYGSFDSTEPGSAVPFYLMEYLGGSETLRGFREFRFRDRNLIYLSAEYRWEASPAWELALFYDAGDVRPNISDFKFRELETSYGFGVRFKTSHAVFLRMDIGWSREGTRVFIKFAPSF